MSCDFRTEASVKALIKTTADIHDANAEIFTTKRIQGKGTIIRNVTFEVRCGAENEALINALSALTLTYPQDIWLDGSEINLQSGQNEIDYIYLTAVIRPILGA